MATDLKNAAEIRGVLDGGRLQFWINTPTGKWIDAGGDADTWLTLLVCADSRDGKYRIKPGSLATPAPSSRISGDALMQLVFRYGAARCDVDRSNTPGNQRACNEAIAAIRNLAAGVPCTMPEGEADAWGVIGADGKLLLAEKRQLLAYFDNPPRPLVWGDSSKGHRGQDCEPEPVVDVVILFGKTASCREREGHGLPDGKHALYAAGWKCTSCGMVNHGNARRCMGCGALEDCEGNGQGDAAAQLSDGSDV